MDVSPKKKTTPRERVAQLVRVFGATERGERVSAWLALERTMKSEGISWSDVGNWIEHGGELKLTEEELHEIYEAAVQEATKRVQAQQSNGHITLPEPSEMAEYCHERLGRLKDDKQRDFVSDMYVITRRGMNLSPGRLGYLASIYIQIGGRT